MRRCVSRGSCRLAAYRSVTSPPPLRWDVSSTRVALTPWTVARFETLAYGCELRVLEEARLPKPLVDPVCAVAGRSGLVLQSREGLRKGLSGVDPVPLSRAEEKVLGRSPTLGACRHGGAACRRVFPPPGLPRGLDDRGACCPPRRRRGPLPPNRPAGGGGAQRRCRKTFVSGAALIRRRGLIRCVVRHLGRGDPAGGLRRVGRPGFLEGG